MNFFQLRQQNLVFIYHWSYKATLLGSNIGLRIQKDPKPLKKIYKKRDN